MNFFTGIFQGFPHHKYLQMAAFEPRRLPTRRISTLLWNTSENYFFLKTFSVVVEEETGW